jgi:predicted thioredoxin/glutaredoxin
MLCVRINTDREISGRTNQKISVQSDIFLNWIECWYPSFDTSGIITFARERESLLDQNDVTSRVTGGMWRDNRRENDDRPWESRHNDDRYKKLKKQMWVELKIVLKNEIALNLDRYSSEKTQKTTEGVSGRITISNHKRWFGSVRTTIVPSSRGLRRPPRK